jgi:pimeloyl-ACP methyl ester carboxylesterase
MTHALLFSVSMRKPVVVLVLVSILAASCAHVRPSESVIAGPAGAIHVSDGGRGTALPILFVHGNGANLTQWQAQLDHVRQSRRAVALDLRGMGKSAVPANGDYSIEAMASDVAAVADALQLRRFIIVGHSYGGGADIRAFKGPRLAIISASLAKNPSSFHSQFPEVPSREMEGVSHWLMMDKPDDFNRILDDFLATLR